ncbi:MAG: ATP-binding protein [Chryseobacterium sp.]|nr:MAG: ATP-binding protein [Chryseobacterium sp.]
MKFYSSSFSSNERKYPCITFYKNNWNDYGWVITYGLTLRKSYNEEVHLGDIKILDKITSETVIPENFTKLPVNQCSLGQSLEYYELVKQNLPQDFESVFKALNDIAIDDEIKKDFESLDGYQTALLRFGAASRALDEAKMLLFENRRRFSDDMEFTYTIKLPEADLPHSAYFDFKQTDSFPFRINVIIGKNGTGKTQFMGKMVNSISGLEHISGFTPFTPQFNKIISISYSLFDDFPKPNDTTVFSYKYIGLRTNDEEIISDAKLSEKLRNAFQYIIRLERESEWFNIVNNIIPLENLGLTTVDDLNMKWVENISYEKSKRLSSGQSILLFILTELIANIQEETLILFDEPETHLHPTAIAELMNCFSIILETYKSFAIVSTHSPIVLQDVPSRYVKVFDRIGNTPFVKALEIESFGENISILTNSVFQTSNVKELYKIHLESLKNNFMSNESINEVFDNRLSFNAQLYLSALDNSTF